MMHTGPRRIAWLGALFAAALLSIGGAGGAAGVASAQALPNSRVIGAYFTLVNTYLYTKSPREGRRYLVRPRQAYNVLDVTTAADESLWFLIVYPAETDKISGVGYTTSAPHELLTAQQEPVLVFSRIPNSDRAEFTIARVPSTGVELLNETLTGEPFTPLDWQKVRYSFEQPLRAWARGSAGIYRPGKTAAFLSRVYGEMVTRNVEKDLQARLLSGVVHVGDTLRDVRWALGEPLRSQDETIADAKRTIWQYPERTVTFEAEVVKQID